MDPNSQQATPQPEGDVPQMPPANVGSQQPQQQTTQFKYWYIPGKTVFTAIQAIASIYPGLVVVTDAKSGQELFRYNLGSDIKISATLGTVRISFINGQKHGYFDRPYNFTFYNPRWPLLSTLFIFMGSGDAKSFAVACKQAAGVAQ